MNIFRYACKEPGKSILVENSDSKELEVVDSVKLKCKNDRSWNITEKTKIKTCVCKYIQKLWSCNHILVSLAYPSNSTYSFMIWCIIRIIIRIIITGSHCTDPPRPPLNSNLRITGWDGSPILIGMVKYLIFRFYVSKHYVNIKDVTRLETGQPCLSFQGITYICKDGMKMKDGFDRKNVTLQCKANNTFDEVLSWPQCISSKK